jgi:hypothetical protein
VQALTPRKILIKALKEVLKDDDVNTRDGQMESVVEVLWGVTTAAVVVVIA